MKAKCTVCRNVVRINEHRVFLQHTMTIRSTDKDGDKTVKLETSLCKGSYKKAFTVQPD